MQSLIEKASVLHEALPYIRRFHGRTFVVKYGGHAMVDAELKTSFAKDICLLRYVGIQVVVVHGGGPQINSTLEKMGVGSTFVAGLRITDEATMDVVEMVLGGQVNQEIVGLICHQGGRAVGLSGKDDAFIRARKLETVRAKDKGGERDVDPGRVGEVQHINPEIVDNLVRSRIHPGGGAGRSRRRQPLAQHQRRHRGRQSRRSGQSREAHSPHRRRRRARFGRQSDSLAHRVRGRSSSSTSGVISGGMIPKVQCGLEALAGGVKKVHMIDGRLRHAVLLEIFTDEGIGTEITR